MALIRPRRPGPERDVLPISDRPYEGPMYEDAKDPDTTFPPIEPLRPPAGAPNVLVVLLDDVGFGCVERVRRPVRDADRGAARGERAEVTTASTRPRCARRRGQALLTGRNHHSVGHGRHHRDRDVGAGLQLGAAEHVRAAGRDAEAERLLRPRSSASATRCRCGRRARWARSTRGRPAAAASSTSTASSAARRTSATRRSTRARRRSSRRRRRRRATTSPRT